MVCLEFFVPLENFPLIWRSHHCRWRNANFDLCSALMAIDHWRCHTYQDTGHPFIIIISEGLWHSHLMPSQCCSGAVFICFNDLRLSRLGFEHPTYRLRVERSNPLRHRRGFKIAKVNRYTTNCAIRSLGLIIGSHWLVIRSLDRKISFSRIPIRLFDFHTVCIIFSVYDIWRPLNFLLFSLDFIWRSIWINLFIPL